MDRCDQPRGYVLSTEPSAGTRLESGEDVFVRVTGGPPPAARCVEPTGTWQQVFDLVRFARGLGPTPDLAGDVALSVGEDSPVRLSPAEAEDPDNWVICGDDQCHSALAALEETLTAPRRFLAVDEGSPRLCRFAEAPGDQALSEHGPSYVYGDEPTDGVFCPPLPVLQVGWTGDWRIASIRLRPPHADWSRRREQRGLASSLPALHVGTLPRVRRADPPTIRGHDGAGAAADPFVLPRQGAGVGGPRNSGAEPSRARRSPRHQALPRHLADRALVPAPDSSDAI
ncbi:hypothetical protein [Nocardioides immobilis]|uniref:hypothetical protein n=1 Tax=Nocardioides immobilis TaxID=2049295 RepID=UPI0026A07FE7